MFPNIASTNQFGSPDLDMRPPEMLRSTMNTWVQCCENCGYSAPCIGDGDTSVSSVIASSKYESLRSYTSFPKLANQFLCWKLIAESEGKYDSAGWAALHAAWVCDDSNKCKEAIQCREYAISMFEHAIDKEIKFAEDSNSAFALLADLFRRVGEFEMAFSLCKNLLGRKDIGNITDIAKFQMALIMKEDIGCHSCDEIVEQAKV